MVSRCESLGSAIFVLLLTSSTLIALVPVPAARLILTDSSISLARDWRDSANHSSWVESLPGRPTHVSGMWYKLYTPDVCRGGGRPHNGEVPAVNRETEEHLRIPWSKKQEFSAFFPRNHVLPTICISVAFRSSRDRLTQRNFTEQRLKHEYDTSRDRLTQRNFTEQRFKHEYDTRKTKTKRKWTKNRSLYYANSTGTRQLQLLSGDISQNPGPCLTSGNGGQKKQRRPAPKCSTCEKTVARSLLEFTRLEFT